MESATTPRALIAPKFEPAACATSQGVTIAVTAYGVAIRVNRISAKNAAKYLFVIQAASTPRALIAWKFKPAACATRQGVMVAVL